MVFVHHTMRATEQFESYCRKLDDYSAKDTFTPAAAEVTLFYADW